MNDIVDKINRLEHQLMTKDADIAKWHALNLDLMTNCNQLRERCWKAESELAKWQKIAIEERTGKNYLQSFLRLHKEIPIDLLPSWRAQAESELSIQISQETGYLRRLEDAFLETTRQCVYSNFGMDGKHHPEGEDAYAEKVARDALAKIREGR